MSQPDKLIIFDTTLRDGEQSPGASMTKDEKVRIAKMLERMRVDVIEAGFPIASPGRFRGRARRWRGRSRTAWSAGWRAPPTDIDRAGEALKDPPPAAFTPSSPPRRST
jgi:2-isopropylmalate synthase